MKIALITGSGGLIGSESVIYFFEFGGAIFIPGRSFKTFSIFPNHLILKYSESLPPVIVSIYRPIKKFMNNLSLRIFSRYITLRISLLNRTKIKI